MRKWTKRNPKLEAMVKHIMGDVALRVRVFTLDNYECVYCGKHLKRKRVNPERTIDHLSPISTMTRVDMSAVCHPSNLVTACQPCNFKLADADLFSKSPKFGRFRFKGREEVNP